VCLCVCSWAEVAASLARRKVSSSTIRRTQSGSSAHTRSTLSYYQPTHKRSFMFALDATWSDRCSYPSSLWLISAPLRQLMIQRRTVHNFDDCLQSYIRYIELHRLDDSIGHQLQTDLDLSQRKSDIAHCTAKLVTCVSGKWVSLSMDKWQFSIWGDKYTLTECKNDSHMERGVYIYTEGSRQN